ncbi:hypothetical protein JOC94_002102 [Bacillus thermophilus]|uniref:Uncharacterized protein n=1 Tax=Siminovitchia thermophila TaxID=1245522 RepID=A0ABS2R6Y5_9BACI|nr:hypothetical protein [Siminovitchia thermophila]
MMFSHFYYPIYMIFTIIFQKNYPLYALNGG